MAIDTRTKRASAARRHMPWRRGMPFADGAIDAGDRRSAGRFYSGLDSTSIAADPDYAIKVPRRVAAVDFPPYDRRIPLAFYQQLKRVFLALERRVSLAEQSTAVVQASPSHPPALPAVVDVIDTNLTLSAEDLNQWQHWDCQAAASLTLAPPAVGSWIGIANYGTFVLTVKNSAGTTMATLNQYQHVLVRSFTDSSGLSAWPTAAIVYGNSGELFMNASVIFRDDGVGIYLKSPDGHYWLMSVDNAGSIGTSDSGTAEASATEPEEDI